MAEPQVSTAPPRSEPPAGDDWMAAPPPAPPRVAGVEAPAAAPTPARRPAAAPRPAKPAAPRGGSAVAALAAPRELTPATWGWRGRLRRYSGGLVQPVAGEAESAHRQAVTTIRQATWTRSVNVMVTNPKGGTGKTPSALLLAGILGSYRGGYVVAWEASESIGSLTRRAEGRPARGLAELVAGIGRIASAGNLGGYTAPQTSHSDVIGSVGPRSVLTARQMLDARAVLDTYYRITVTDTGNNPGHETYLAALECADAVVIPCLVSIDALDGVEQALSVIEGHRGDGLRDRVVVVLGHDGGPEDPEVAAGVRTRLAELGVCAVVEVPFDPAIRLGGEISLSRLSSASINCWTAAGAALVRALRQADTDVDLVARADERLGGGPA